MKLFKNILNSVKPHFTEGGKLEKLYPAYDAFETFLFVPDHTSQSGTHIHDAIDLKRTMFSVIIALIPCLLFGMWNIGYQHFIALGQTHPDWLESFIYGAWRVLPMVIVSYGVGLGIEFAFAISRGHSVNEGYLVTGLLIPMIMPADLPLWMLATAVAFAAAFNAERCDIYTDVDGVYTTDPRICDKAKKLDKISYEEMLELASLGAKVLQTRSVEMAMRFKVKLRVLSSFEEPSEKVGTLVCDEEEIMESNIVSGIAYSRDEAKMTLVSIADRPGIAAAIFGLLSDAGINVDMIIQNIAEAGRTDMTFSCPIDQVSKAEKSLNNAKKEGLINFQDLLADKNVAKISAVGIGMRSQSGVAAKMFQTLSDEGINIKVIATSEIKISVLVDRKYLELAVQSLHDAIELDQISS